MMKLRTMFCTLTAAAVFGALSIQTANAHCQVPCGIFDDYARVKSMLEDTVTIKKAAALVEELAGKTDAQSINQSTRWIYQKESHAQKIISTISDYFLTQRVKTSMDDYEERLVKHHAVMVQAMKAKQTTDAQTMEQLKDAIDALKAYYPEHEHEHP